MDLYYLKQIGANPKSLLDIGCNVGEFYSDLKKLFPELQDVALVDANENLVPYLEKLSVEYKILTLSNEEKEVIWYSTNKNPICTGNSYYLEKTIFYNTDSLESNVKTTSTLDNEFTNRQFDLIKLDTQGSELDILKGGEQLCAKAKYIICEVSLIEYNQSAPLKEEVISYLRERGFTPIKTIGTHRANLNGKNIILQEDILFKNIGSTFKKFITPDMLDNDWL